ncbi:hypothetical protein LTS18_005160 [Coniosporium uncinatum]|uniref:Uncharacterized protein n=1 Tax=Coniosporium uncinatum TaxID=93489 RepID=A0ACC3DRE2_9PEZI|nr:hypothetical protein LTS18_005160 [Coniosporium uncinatum]
MHGPRQAAQYIFRDNGDLVWSGYGYYSIRSTNFHATRWKGHDVLFSFEGDHNPAYGHGHGHTTIMDQHYETIRELRAGNHKLTDKHEFHVIDEKTALIQIYQPVPRDLSAYSAKKEQQRIVDAVFQELGIESGKLLFEWSSLAHVSPNESVLPITEDQAESGYNSSDAWDYFHINSVDKDGEGNYLISARDACAVHKINGTDGEILWRLGGKRSDFELGSGVEFCFQHHARFTSRDREEEVISLYDNSAHGSESGSGKEIHTAPTSSGKIVHLNTRTWKATLVQAFYPPDGLLSRSQGSMQLLPNDNAVVNWGSEGALTESGADGTPIFHAYMDSGFLGEGVQNYRAFRYNWTGLPSEEPAIVCLGDKHGSTVYVSWNGDTETDVWRFYAVDEKIGPRWFLGASKRTAFETAHRVKVEHIERILAEAVDAQGKVLRTSGIASVEEDIKPAGHVGSVDAADEGSDISLLNKMRQYMTMNMGQPRIERSP